MNLEERVAMLKMRIGKFKKDYSHIFKPSVYEKRIWSYEDKCFYAPKE